jgi:DNA-binding transcriptional regulator YiaG
MAYQIPAGCTGCQTCVPYCPVNAISVQDGHFWINPAICNNCEGYYPEPQCVVMCDDSVPQPYQAMKGRNRSISNRLSCSPSLFPDGKTHPFASSIIIWEACNLLAQRDSLEIEYAQDGRAYYQKRVNQDQGLISLSIPMNSKGSEEQPGLQDLDIRAACFHLIFAAYATGVEKPWEQSFVFTDQHLESYLGLDKRKDLNKITRLNLLKTLVSQVCQIKMTIEWPQQGKVKGFSIRDQPLWQLLQIQHHFQQDEWGSNHLIGLTWEVRAGEWSQYFLDRQGCRRRESFYQYSSLPQSLLSMVMSYWQQHEGGVRILLWLIFKIRLGRKQRITVPTLMRLAYGENRVLHANACPQEHSRLIRTFEGDLEALNQYGLKPHFDPVTYPPEIRPLWYRLQDVPEDADEALDFWIEDGCSGAQLTSSGPRGKWNLLMHARIQQFELPQDWLQPLQEHQSDSRTVARSSTKRTRQAPTSATGRSIHPGSSFLRLTGAEIAQARKVLGLSQRELARRAGKSQSWIRDIEHERFQIRTTDQQLLFEILKLGENRA